MSALGATAATSASISAGVCRPGARRISVGGALALAAWTGFIRAAQLLQSEGRFDGLANLVPYAEINTLFTTGFRRQ